MNEGLMVRIALVALFGALAVMCALLVVIKAVRKRRMAASEAATAEVLPRVLVVLDSDFWALTEVFGRPSGDAERVAVDLLAMLRGADRERLAHALDLSGTIDRAGAHLRSRLAGRRHRAADLLGAAGSRRYVPALTQCLWDRDGDVRTAAARALGQIGDPMAAGDLLAALDDGRVSTNTVSMALRRIGLGASDVLLEGLRTGSGPVRIVAAELVGSLGLVEAVNLLVVGLVDEDLRPSAARSLGRLGLRESVPRLVAELNRELVRSTRGRDIDFTVELVVALGRIGDQSARPVLTRCTAMPRRISAAATTALESITPPRPGRITRGPYTTELVGPRAGAPVPELA